jgi:Coenzyme PQQ synthesis protein D (PqqD)
MRPRRQPDVVFRELADGETMLLTVSGEAAIVLNPVGAVIWSLCDGDHTLDEIAALIGERFPDLPLEQIAADVRDLIEQLSEAAVIRDES